MAQAEDGDAFALDVVHDSDVIGSQKGIHAAEAEMLSLAGWIDVGAIFAVE